MSIKVLATNAGWSMIAHLLARGSLVVSSMLLARSLDVKGFAAYSYFQLTASTLAAYAAMGMGVTAARFFAESSNVREERMPPIGMLWILSILGGLVLAAVILYLPFSAIDGEQGIPRWIVALGVFAMSLGVVPSGGVLGLERFRCATFVSFASASALVGGALAAGVAESALAAMAALIVACLVQSLGDTVVVLHAMGWRRLARYCQFDKGDLRKIVGLAGPMLLVSLVAASGSWVVGRLILIGPDGESGFARYAIGLQWYALALFLPGMVTRVLFSRVTRARVDSSPTTIKKLVRNGSLMATSLGVLVSAVGVILSPWLVGLYGVNYAVDKWLLAAFLAASIPSAPANSLGNAIVADNGQRAWLYMTVVWFFLLVMLATMMSPRGVWAGPISHAVASLTLASLALAVARRRGIV